MPIAQRLADPVEEQALHMVNTDPSRTPTFTISATPTSSSRTSNPCTGFAVCVTPGFAWNHGDFQDEIGSTWVGFVGPGVIPKDGIDSTTWTDHTNVRPTILSLAGLKDDYVDDGRVLVEALTNRSTPHGMAARPRARHLQLEQEDDLVNSPFGPLGTATLRASTYALESTDDAVYNSVEDQIQSLTASRDATLAGHDQERLRNDAAFNSRPINPVLAGLQIVQAQHADRGGSSATEQLMRAGTTNTRSCGRHVAVVCGRRDACAFVAGRGGSASHPDRQSSSRMRPARRGSECTAAVGAHGVHGREHDRRTSSASCLRTPTKSRIFGQIEMLEAGDGAPRSTSCCRPASTRFVCHDVRPLFARLAAPGGARRRPVTDAHPYTPVYQDQ